MVDVLEIGCFDGYVLQKLKKEGYNVNGCDPSEGAEIGKGFGLNIQKEFFDPNNYLNYCLLIRAQTHPETCSKPTGAGFK